MKDPSDIVLEDSIRCCIETVEKNYMLYYGLYRHIPLVEQITKLPDLVLCLLYELLMISFVEYLQVAGEVTRVSPNFHSPNSRKQ